MRNGIQSRMTLLALGLLAAAVTGEARATPPFGGDCLMCHSYDASIMSVTGHDDTVGLPARLDGGTSAALKTFAVTAGQSVTLSFNVLAGQDKYAVSLRNLDGGGVEQSASNMLVFTPDGTWTDLGGRYATDPTPWGGATVHTFNVTVDANTPADFYALETQTGRNDGDGQWAQNEEFYLQVVAPNSPPTVSVTEPAAGEVFYGDSVDIVISANASDSEGTVTKVEFFEGTTLLGEAVSSPYSFEWLAVGVGSYTLTAKATDDGGMTGTSSPVTITVESALDDDDDGVTNDQDSCSDTPSCATVDAEGCPSDSDGDDVHDGCDQCPGQDDVDSDGDGVLDCADQCPDDPDKTEAGDCGCGLADADSDGDGVPDCIDNCVDDQNPEQADSDANGIGDACDTIAPDEGDGDDTGDDGADDEGDVDDDNDEDTNEDDAADDGDDNADDDCGHTGDEDEDPDDADDDEGDGDDGSEADDVDNGDADDVADDDPDEVTEQEAPRRFGSGKASAPGMCGNGIALAMIASFLASLALRFTGKRRSF